MLDMTGKVVFIAGAGSAGQGWGNGNATAVLMARQGASVFGVDRDESALAETSSAMASEGHHKWAARTCNMTQSQEVEDAVKACLAQYGRIDVLINNVGGSAPGDPVSMTEEA